MKAIQISEGIRKLKRPQYTMIDIEWSTHKPFLIVTHADGEVESLKISKRVAEVLIARGMSYGGK